MRLVYNLTPTRPSSNMSDLLYELLARIYSWTIVMKKGICLQYGFMSSMSLCDALNIWSRVDVKVETPFPTHL